VANVRVHGTTNRVVLDHMVEERESLLPLATGSFDAVLQLERRITNDGCISVGGNLYSVPNGTRKRPVEVELTAHQVRILEDGAVVAVHGLLTGRNERSVLTGHRTRLNDAIAAKLASINRTAKETTTTMNSMTEVV
jgi:hypothetical protein